MQNKSCYISVHSLALLDKNWSHLGKDSRKKSPTQMTVSTIKTHKCSLLFTTMEMFVLTVTIFL